VEAPRTRSLSVQSPVGLPDIEGDPLPVAFAVQSPVGLPDI